MGSEYVHGRLHFVAAVALYNPEFFIFKFHGDIGSPESIILTSRDYDRLILRNPHARSFLQADFLNYTVLFVGYSLAIRISS